MTGIEALREQARQNTARLRKEELKAAKGSPKGRARRAKGRFASLNEFRDRGSRSLSTKLKCTWLFLWTWEIDGVVSVSYAELAGALNVSRDTSMRYVKALRERGFVTVTRRGSPKAGANQYRLNPNPEGIQ